MIDLHEVWPRRFYPLPSNRLLVGGLRGFAVLDLADPRMPGATRHLRGAGQVASVEGNRVYYTRHDIFELEVLDVSNAGAPGFPDFLARFEAPYWDGAVAENIAYGVDRLKREFLVWDVSDATNPVPKVLGRAPSEIGARRVYIYGRVAYVLPLDLGAGIEMFDIANSAEPRLIGRLDPQGAVYDMTFSGTNGWLSVAQKGLMRFDIFNPSSLAPVSAVPLGVFPESVRVYDGSLFVADESMTDLRVFDAESGELRESIVTGETIEWVHVEGSVLASAGRAGVRTFSIRGSATVLPLGTLRLEERIWMSARDGNHLYLNADPGLVVVDLATPSAPRVVFRGAAATMSNGWHYWTTVHGEAGLLCIGTLEGLTMMDVSDASQPAVLKQLPLGWVNSIYRAGNFLYVGREKAGLTVMDISNPRAPATVRDIPLSGTHFLFAREGNLLVVGANHISGSSVGEFVLFDISDPGNPSLIGYGPGLQPIVSMQIENGRLFALTSARLRIFDLSEVPRTAGPSPINVSMPLLAYHYDLERSYLAGGIEGSTVFTAEGNNGLSLWRVEPLIKLKAEWRGHAVRLSWSAAAGSANYEVLTATAPGGPWQTAATTNSTSIELPTGEMDTAAFFQIRVQP